MVTPLVNGNDGIPFSGGHRLERLVPQDTSISDQDVNRAESFNGSLDNGVTIHGMPSLPFT
jgi:hypothetical protein